MRRGRFTARPARLGRKGMMGPPRQGTFDASTKSERPSTTAATILHTCKQLMPYVVERDLV